MRRNSSDKLESEETDEVEGTLKIKVNNKSIFDSESDETIKNSPEVSVPDSENINSVIDCLEFRGDVKVEETGSDSDSSLDHYLYKASDFSLFDDKFDKIENKAVVRVEETGCESQEDCDEPSVSSYFDFSSIIKSQQLLNVLSDRKAKNSSIQEGLQKPTLSAAISKETNFIETLNVSELLAIGERGHSGKFDATTFSESDDSSNDVGTIPPEGVEITIELPQLVKKKKEKKGELEVAIKRQLNAVRRTNQIYLHKVHLLCLIAHGMFINKMLNNDELLCTALSIVPSENFFPPKYANISYLEKLISWFSKKIILSPKPRNESSWLECLIKQFDTKEAISIKDLVLMFVCTVRVLGLKCRLMMSLQPLPLKPPTNELKNSDQGEVSIKGAGKKFIKSSSSSPMQLAVDATESKALKRGKLKPDKKLTVKKLKTLSNSNQNDDGTSTSNLSPLKDLSKNLQEPVASTKSTSKKHGRKSKVPLCSTESSHKTGSQKSIKVLNVKNNKPIGKSTQSLITNNKASSKCCPESPGEDKNCKCDFWAEVYLEDEEKWLSVNVAKAKVHCVQDIYNGCSRPVYYILGFSNDQSIKDLTRRYAPQWMTVTRKQRVDESWWNKALLPWMPVQTAQDKEEDYDLDKILMDKPLPTSVLEYKNHPLYALRRHLLKFEAIYPPDAPTLGFVKNEPIYSRLCVHELHSRETWMRKAKLVRRNETPYKIVKTRPKYDKSTGSVIKNLDLELFGHWQVDDYIPPPAVNGKVPRNEYGNVELYKPCMLPSGTVHLQVPGLNRVAKKLGIDCAPAVVGWEFHSGGSHPVLDGFIVCEEFKDLILEAWNEDVDEAARRNKEKVKQRAYKNWKRLIRGLQIRDRLENRYKFGIVSSKSNKKSNTSKNKKQ